MKVLKYGVVALTSLLLISGCGNNEVVSNSNEINHNESGGERELTKSIKLRDGTKVSEKDIEAYKKEHNGKNLTRKYIVGVLLDKKYPMNEEKISSETEKLKIEMGNNFEAYLNENGLTKATIDEEVKYSYQLQQLGEDSLAITDGKLQKFYDSWVPSMVIQHIMVNEESTINEVKQKLDEGVDFTTLVNEYSIDEQTKGNEGKWEGLKKGDLLSSLEDSVFQLQEGEVSAPIKTIVGWHIVKMLEQAEKKDYDQVKKQVKNEYISKYLSRVYLEEVTDNLLKNEIKPLDDNLKKVLGIS